jgi:glycosyltransferase involved in cell wall biosynthesis
MISSIVITYNEEENIRECLESLKWTDEIIVVDSNSTDRTLEIAKEFTGKITEVNELTFGEKKNLGIDSAKGEWILWLDADERITPELQEEITKLLKNKPEVDAFEINRKSYFISKFIKHCGWYPDHTIRLFKRTAGIRFDTSHVHEKVNYKGKVKRLKSEIVHYTDRDFEHYMNKLNSYTTLSAKDLFAKGKNTSVIDIIFRPVFTFFKMYFLKLGFLDGFIGLVLCTLSGVHVFFKYSKLYYLNKRS